MEGDEKPQPIGFSLSTTLFLILFPNNSDLWFRCVSFCFNCYFNNLIGIRLIIFISCIFNATIGSCSLTILCNTIS